MAKFCPNCGAELEEGAKFCKSCGAKIGAGAAAGAAAGSKFDEAAEKVKNLNNTADSTADFDPDDIAKNKVFAILAYFGWLVLIPIFAAKESKFARFHANQGIVLAIASTLGIILISLLPSIRIVYLIAWLFELAVFACMLIGIYNAANGRAKDLPVIGTFRILNY